MHQSAAGEAESKLNHRNRNGLSSRPTGVPKGPATYMYSMKVNKMYNVTPQELEV